jgi:hypothetical protein
MGVQHRRESGGELTPPRLDRLIEQLERHRHQARWGVAEIEISALDGLTEARRFGEAPDTASEQIAPTTESRSKTSRCACGRRWADLKCPASLAPDADTGKRLRRPESPLAPAFRETR